MFLQALGRLHVFCGCGFQGMYLILLFLVLFIHRYSLPYCCFLPVQIEYTQQNSQQQLLHFIKTLDDPQVHFLQCCQELIHCKQFKQLLCKFI